MHLHIFVKLSERLTCRSSQGLSLSSSMSIGMWLDWLTQTNHWLSRHLSIKRIINLLKSSTANQTVGHVWSIWRKCQVSPF